MTLWPGKPVQIAYFVSDIRASALSMSETFGAGPFFVVDNIELEWGEHRGKPCHFVHSSAYGQWGELMLELVQQVSEGPSPFRDLFAAGEEGLHHVACFVDSVDQTIDRFADLGHPLAAKAKAKIGTEFAFIDTSEPLGHMIEVYVRDDALAGFYRLVRDAARDWDGRDLLPLLANHARRVVAHARHPDSAETALPVQGQLRHTDLEHVVAGMARHVDVRVVPVEHLPARYRSGTRDVPTRGDAFARSRRSSPPAGWSDAPRCWES